MLKDKISVFLNTWANYNENGADNGFWVELPLSDTEYDEALEELAELTGEDVDEMEVFVNDVDSELDGFDFSEYESFEAINDVVTALDELDEADYEKVAAIIEAGLYSNIQDAIDNADDYDLYEGETLEDYAYNFIDEMYGYNKDNELLLRYFDYESFARDLTYDGYTETNYGVLRES